MRARRLLRYCWLGLLLGLAGLAHGAEYRPLPPPAPTGLDPANWLLHDAAGNRLILYLPGYHAPAHTYYQWLRLVPLQPFRLAFTAQPGFTIFLDNQLVFTAPAPGSYAVDLGSRMPATRQGQPHLLAVWQPDGYPLLSSFAAETGVGVPAVASQPQAASPTRALLRLAPLQSQNVLLLLLLLLGVLYGIVRSTFPAALAPVLQISELSSSNNEPQAFLTRPAFTLLNLVLVALFALSLALLLTALRTDLGSLPLVRQLLNVPESAVMARVLFYTLLIMSFVVAKFLLLELMSYIFDLRELVNVHYREFLRTTLLLGLGLPLVLVLYLGLNTRWPPVVEMANGSVLLLLTLTVLRVARTLHQRASLLNLHLFAYLCATEILPIAVLLKLIVFTYPA
ncbi:MAG: DUF4271 domain-containing protein [Janthinobacterium lividum]